MQAPDNEFYIGWQPKAPPQQSIFLRKIIGLFLLVVIIMAAAVVYFQKDFSSSVFEFKKVTTLEGKLLIKPVPMLLVHHGENAMGDPVVQEILLVGEGKRGAEKVIQSILPGSMVEVQGYLVYHDGHTLLEVRHLKPASQISESADVDMDLGMQDSGGGTISGEIADPKCFFGVMKPGEGKTHLSCAARCIAGGIPPVLKRIDASGDAGYYIILDHEGQPLNTFILPFVGDHVFLQGKIKSSGDWKYIFLNNNKSITRVTRELSFQNLMCYAEKF